MNEDEYYEHYSYGFRKKKILLFFTGLIEKRHSIKQKHDHSELFYIELKMYFKIYFENVIYEKYMNKI